MVKTSLFSTLSASMHGIAILYLKKVVNPIQNTVLLCHHSNFPSSPDLCRYLLTLSWHLGEVANIKGEKLPNILICEFSVF